MSEIRNFYSELINQPLEVGITIVKSPVFRVNSRIKQISFASGIEECKCRILIGHVIEIDWTYIGIMMFHQPLWTDILVTIGYHLQFEIDSPKKFIPKSKKDFLICYSGIELFTTTI